MIKRHLEHTFVIVLGLLLAASGSLFAQPKKQTSSSRNFRSMARAYMAFANYDKAHALAAQAIREAQKQHADTAEMALCLIDMGTVCSYEGFLKQAQENLEQGIELQKQALFNDHPYVAHSLRMLSDVCRRQGNLLKAEDTLGQAVAIMLKNCDLESREMAPFIAEAAHLQFAKGELDKAKNNYMMAMDLYESSYGANHLVTANLQEDYARVLMSAHEYDQADDLLSKSLTTKTRIFGRYHLSLVDCWLAKASLCQIQGKTEQCEYYLAKTTETAAESRNVITIAQIYEKVNQIRAGNLIASAL